MAEIHNRQLVAATTKAKTQTTNNKQQRFRLTMLQLQWSVDLHKTRNHIMMKSTKTRRQCWQHKRANQNVLQTRAKIAAESSVLITG